MLDQLYRRYIGASVASLAVDFATFTTALALGVPPAIAAACGYVVGIGCHWLISSRFVFTGRVADDSVSRRHQQALFVLSAFVGLGITTGLVGLGSRWGMDPRLAKGFAIVASFQATYLLRKKVVFA
jgi:putative flippase GtrA